MTDVREGASAIVRASFKGNDGQAMAATGVTISARKPDGTEVIGEVTSGATAGQFEARFVADMHGVWWAKATCTGPEVAKDDCRWTVSRLRYDVP